MCLFSNLQEQVSQHQKSTGQPTMMVVVENSDKTIGIHSVSSDPYVGLLVDGRPPSINWYQMAEDYHPLEVKHTLH